MSRIMDRKHEPLKERQMGKWIAVVACVVVAGVVIAQWPDIQRYRRIRAT